MRIAGKRQRKFHKSGRNAPGQAGARRVLENAKGEGKHHHTQGSVALKHALKVSWVPVKLSLRKFMPVKGSRTELSIE
jgi:hypothetical protein